MGLQTSSTPVNLHSPTAIGDVTPNTIDGITCTITTTAGTSTIPVLVHKADGSRVPFQVQFGDVWNNDRIISPNFISFNAEGVNKFKLGQEVNGVAITSGGALSFGDTFGNSFDAIVQRRRAGFIELTGLAITTIPTSPSGLSSGDVYANAGILTIVP